MLQKCYRNVNNCNTPVTIQPRLTFGNYVSEGLSLGKSGVEIKITACYSRFYQIYLISEGPVPTGLQMHHLEKVINSIHRKLLDGKTAYEYDTAYNKAA